MNCHFILLQRMPPEESAERPKTEKELRKEAAKAEKLRKFAEKQARLQEERKQREEKKKVHRCVENH